MAFTYHAEGPIVIRASYDNANPTTATATYNGSLGVLATGTGADRELAIADCLTNLAAFFPGLSAGPLTTQNLLLKCPILVLPEAQQYQVL